MNLSQMSRSEMESAHAHCKVPLPDSPRLTYQEFWQAFSGLSHSGMFHREVYGQSAKGTPLEAIWPKDGGGEVLLIFSQMHGNESTGSKAMLDLLGAYTLWADKKIFPVFVPVLNPDGAELFTRVNHQGLDINRDALAKQTPEARAFFTLVDKWKPKYALNLHDQRNLFGTPDGKPAVFSLLAPSVGFDKPLEPQVVEGQKWAGALRKSLEGWFDERVSKYTDEFYPTAFGDNLQKMGVCTLTFECGPWPGDRLRDNARLRCWAAMLTSFEVLHDASHLSLSTDLYAKMPYVLQNQLDLVLANVRPVAEENGGFFCSLGFTKDYVFSDNEIIPRLSLHVVGDLRFYNSFTFVDCSEFSFVNRDGVGYRDFELYSKNKLVYKCVNGVLV